MSTLKDISAVIVDGIKNGNKIMIFGVGGNASNASHFAGELAGKFEDYEDPLPVICLNDNMSIITAITNDFGWEYVFGRQVRGLGKEGDVLIGFSISGEGEYLKEAFIAGISRGCTNILLNGKSDPANCSHLYDLSISLGHEDTAIVQEVQLCWVHEISRGVKRGLRHAKI